MQGDATTYFVKEILPLLVAPAVMCFVLIWFPWKRLVWLPKNAKKIEDDARRLLSSGNPEGAYALFEKTYGLCPEHAQAIVEAFKQKELSAHANGFRQRAKSWK